MKKFTKILTLALNVSLLFSNSAFANTLSPKYKTIAENLPYTGATPYSGVNLIYVTDGSNSGYIDFDGKTIVQPQQYSNISCESEYVLTKGKDGSFTLFDNKGNIKMPPHKFRKASQGGYSPSDLSFSIGKNMVVMSNGSQFKLVDFDGEELTALTKLLNGKGVNFRFEENLVRIRESDGTVYFVDTKGSPVLPKEQGSIYMDFSGGAVLKTKLDPTQENEMVTPLAFYDGKGKLICNVPNMANGIQYSVAFSETDLATLLQFSEGYAAYEDKNTKLVGFIDKTGKIVIPAKFKSCIIKFQYGVAGVHLPDDSDHLSFIDTKGNVLFSIPNPSPWPHGNINGFFVNTYLPDAGPFTVIVNDIKGSQLFSSAETYKSDGTSSYGYIFGSGDPVPSKTIADITIDQYSHTAIMQTTDNRFGLDDLNGNEILPPVYDTIQPMESLDGRLLVIKDGKLSIIQILADKQPIAQTSLRSAFYVTIIKLLYAYNE